MQLFTAVFVNPIHSGDGTPMYEWLGTTAPRRSLHPTVVPEHLRSAERNLLHVCVGHGLDPSMNWIGLNWVG